MTTNAGYEFYEKVLGKPKLVIAPMVEQSELAFRLLCRDHGAQLCYTPMWHAGIFAKDEKYRRAAIEEAPGDRPLLFQFCANKPETFADACALAEPHCDGIDLNLGCPQVIAQRGHYGAFLMEEIDLVEKIIQTACKRITKPITCKIRVFDKIDDTVMYAKRLENAGAKIITVHGRLRKQKGPLTGIANWDHIKAVKENVSVPVFANGNIQYLRDVQKCFEYTGVDAVMSAEGVLYNPALFLGKQPPVWEMADKYLAYAEKHRPPLGYVRGHLFRLWHHCLCKHTDLRTPMGVGKTFEALVKISNELKVRSKADAEKDKADGNDSEEPGKLPYWRCQPYVRPPPKLQGKRALEENPEEAEKKKLEKQFSKRKLLQKKHREHGKGLFPKTPRDKWPLCKSCLVNPWGSKCLFNRCRKCCREKAEVEILDCPGHRLWYHKNLSAGNQKGGKYIENGGENDEEKTENIEASHPLMSNTNNKNTADGSEEKCNDSVT